MKKILITAGFVIALLSCTKENREPAEEANATIVDFNGLLDGCGILIELDNGSYLEPVALPANTILEPGRRVDISYRVVERASNCMAGETVEITRLRYL